MDPLAAARLLIGVAGLLVAATSDVRTRRVADPLWIVLGTAGLLLASYEVLASGTGIERLGVLAATAILLYAVFFGEPLFDERGLRLRPFRLLAFAFAAVLVVVSAGATFARGGADATSFAELLTMPVMVLVYQGFYQVGLLHGGADAKAMIALTVLVPTYPDAAPFPLVPGDPRIQGAVHLLFPFSLVVFVDAAVLYLVLPLALLVYNASRGDLRLPHALVGYRADLEPLPRNAWLMERIDKRGDHVLVLFPRRGRNLAEDARRLREAGVSRAWVQPKVPFMVPLVAGYVAAFLVGNFLVLLFFR
ncbi:MAG: A24 family peptidase C-terminal domain-containing protein [Methanobacteriota archaeon]